MNLQLGVFPHTFHVEPKESEAGAQCMGPIPGQSPTELTGVWSSRVRAGFCRTLSLPE